VVSLSAKAEIESVVRNMLGVGMPGGGTNPLMTPHDLLGSYHTLSGATPGTYLRALTSSTFAFDGIADGDLPSTIVRTSRAITAGNGLTGGGDLSTDRSLALNYTTPSIALGTAAAAGTSTQPIRADATIAAFDVTVPVTLTVSTTGATGSAAYAARRDHAHAITTSSNPGAAASILASDSSGHLRLAGLGIGTAPVANGVQIADAGSFRWSDVELQRKAANVLALATGDSAQSGTFTSGVQGWQIAADGSAEFSNVRIRGELSSATFTYSEITATAGTFGVFKSASTLVNDCTSVTSPTTFYVDAKKSDAGGALFAVGDVLRIKSWTGAAILDNWCTVSAVDNTPGGYTRYTVTKNSGTNGTFRAGTAVVDYGQSGQGYLLMTADAATAPYYDVRTHAGAPWTTETVQARLGNLNGAYGISSNRYGLAVGDYAAGNYMRFEPIGGFVLRAGTDHLQIDGSGISLDGSALTLGAQTWDGIFWRETVTTGNEVARIVAGKYAIGAVPTIYGAANYVNSFGSGLVRFVAKGDTDDTYSDVRLNANSSAFGATLRSTIDGTHTAAVNTSVTTGAAQVLVDIDGASEAIFGLGKHQFNNYYKTKFVSGNSSSASWQTLATITLGLYTIVDVEVRIAGMQSNVAAQWCWLNVAAGRQGGGANVTEAGSHHTLATHFQVVASGNDVLVQFKSDGTNNFAPKGVIIVGGGGYGTWDIN
jgi:hypothetical protein